MAYAIQNLAGVLGDFDTGPYAATFERSNPAKRRQKANGMGLGGHRLDTENYNPKACPEVLKMGVGQSYNCPFSDCVFTDKEYSHKKGSNA